MLYRLGMVSKPLETLFEAYGEISAFRDAGEMRGGCGGDAGGCGGMRGDAGEMAVLF